MPNKITKLTPDQIARFAEWTEEWIKIGLSTEPADFDKATAAALRGYELANLKKPMIVLRMSSPYGATVGGALAWTMLRQLDPKKVGSQVESQVRSQVWSQVGSQVRSQVWSQVWSQVRSQVGSQVGSDALYNNRGGVFWAGWAAYVSFFRDVCGWTDPVLERFSVDEDLVKSCGWVWWHENILAISDRPEALHRDNENRLHCETGPSISYRDGWSLYHWHGTSIPAEWIENKKTLTAQVALKTANIEQRRAACEILGWSRILRELDAKTVDRDNDPQIGDLVEVALPDLPQRAKFLRVQCGTGREFAIGIPPHINKALDAQAWIVGLDARDFLKPEVRT